MPNFILTYHSSKSYDPTQDPDGLATWGAYLNDVIGPNVVDPGSPVFEPTTVVGDAGPATRLGGYSIVTADNLDAALAIAGQCPTVSRGGGVEVGVLAALPSDHPAEQIRLQLSRP